MKTPATLVSLLLALASLQAQAVGRIADVQVLDRQTGAALPLHYHGGSYWVVGAPGARYAITVRSRAPQRLLAVTAVDGVNVVSGETASWAQSGYVLSPRQRTQINGWRKSDSEVAGFEFALAGDSYAARTGRPGHLGVIGVALFREKPTQPQPEIAMLSREAERRANMHGPVSPASPEAAAKAAPSLADGAAASADTASGSFAERAESAAESRATARLGAVPLARLGTGHGQREISRVAHTQFERVQDTPDETVVIRYDSLANLIASGVIRAPLRQPDPAQAFPLSDLAGYVPDPPPLRR